MARTYIIATAIIDSGLCFAPARTKSHESTNGTKGIDGVSAIRFIRLRVFVPFYSGTGTQKHARPPFMRATAVAGFTPSIRVEVPDPVTG